MIVAIVVAIRFLRRAREPQTARRGDGARTRRSVHCWPLGRWVAPPARFVWARVTPGGRSASSSRPCWPSSPSACTSLSPTPWSSPAIRGRRRGDRAAFDVADHLQASWLTDAAKIVGTLGSPAVNLPLAVVAAVALAVRRRWAEAAVLVAAVAITYIGVAELKDATARPRPTGELASASGSSFPSGHAAHAMIFPWLALTLTIRLRPRDNRWVGAARPGNRASGAGRPVARLPPRSLSERRQRRLGAGGGRLRRLRRGRLAGHPLAAE